jgi:regulator of cell morphogenesis and NO signaling
MREIVISGQMKMADIITADKRAMLLMPRFGIDMGVGDKTVKQICREQGIQPDFFLLMVNVFLHPHFFPGKKLKNVDVTLLLLYLANAHEYYIREKIPALQTMVGEFLFQLEQPARGQLDKFFRGYIREVIEHIEYEEKIVFPYIQSLVKPADSGSNPGAVTDPSDEDQKALEDQRTLREKGIREFEKRHNDIEEKLSDLKNLLIKYVPPAGDRYLRIRVLNELIDLEQDLSDHARLEDKVLIPIVEDIEKQLQTR